MAADEAVNGLIRTLALTYISSIKPSDIKKLLDYFKDPVALFASDVKTIASCIGSRQNSWALAESILRFKDFDKVKKDLEQIQKLNISVVTLLIDNYPKPLKYMPDPPPVLYINGEIIQEDTLSVAIVGTRTPTSYGISSAVGFARELASYGITVVSGLARGIDAAAHIETLRAGGRTIAVMANGSDITYPSEHRKLREQIEKNGAVITEFPPGTKPDKWRFPARNRIIAGLSMGCLVVEAPVKSGAMITARLAADYNREVFSVPGSIANPKSAGCNLLLKDGARPATCVEDILEEFGIKLEKKKSITTKKETLNNEEQKILELITGDGILAEMVIQNSGLPSFKVSSLLTGLELKGYIKKLPGNSYVRIGLGN
ncbi:MAG: DNA-processing protein DprA [Firmicutes bacterium]|nr:DNA-processing protein DprA [Bacillota bacterium]